MCVGNRFDFAAKYGLRFSKENDFHSIRSQIEVIKSLFILSHKCENRTNNMRIYWNRLDD